MGAMPLVLAIVQRYITTNSKYSQEDILLWEIYPYIITSFWEVLQRKPGRYFSEVLRGGGCGPFGFAALRSGRQKNGEGLALPLSS